MNYRQEIDGLRALAVLAVIANHFDKAFLPSGHLGVDIFFVISGYVITSSLSAGPESSLGASLTTFYVKRIKRLLPALILCVAVTSLVICLFNPAPGSSLKTGIAALFGLSNIYLFSQAVDYFADSASLNVFTHTWSLGVEEQFYLFYPLLIWFTGLGRATGRGFRTMVLSMSALSLASLLGFIYLSQSHQAAAFFLMPARLWELGAGCLLYVIQRRRSVAWAPPAGSWMVIVAIVVTLFVPGRYGVYSTIAVVALTTLLIAMLRPQTLGYRVLTLPAVVFIGRVSYSLYLWHWSVLALSRWTIGINWWSIPLQAGLMLLLAALSYRFVEAPLRHAQWSNVRHRTIPYGLAASVGAALFLVVLAKPLAAHIYTGELVPQVAGGVRSLAVPYALPDGSFTWQGGKCVVGNNDQVGKDIPIDGCTLGDFERAGRRVLVVGNSYSASFVQSFDKLVMSDRYAVTITSSFGASPAPEMRNDSAFQEASEYYWKTVVPSITRRLRPGDLVFVISDLAELSPAEPSEASRARLAEFGRGLDRFSSDLARDGIELAVMHGLPFIRDANCEPVLAARQWFSVGGGPCRFLSKQDTLSRRTPLHETLSALEASKKLKLVDLMPVFCPGAVCGFQLEGGTMLYRDVWSHPSIEAARMAGPVIEELLVARRSGAP